MKETMSQVTAVPRPVEQVHFPNPSLHDDKWHYSSKRAEDFAGAIVQMAILAQLVSFIFLTKPLSIFLNDNELLALAIMIVGNVLIAFFVLPKLNNRLVAYKKRKRDEYRRENAPALIALFEKEGWKVNNGVDAVSAMVSYDHPYITNAEGVRYELDRMLLSRGGVSALLRIDDDKAEDVIRETTKDKEIESFIRQYESANGTMSAEKREGFIAALNLSL